MEAQRRRLREEIADLDHQSKAVQDQLGALRRELQSVEEATEIQSFGFYKVKYGFPDSSMYEKKLDEVRDQQAALIKSSEATVCPTEWIVEGSKAKGKKLVRDQSKLMLRAFNGESDAAIAKVKYNNVVALDKRIQKAHEAINKLGEASRISITTTYLRLKLTELYLVHEHREKEQEEKEQQRRLKEQMREEQKAEQEIEKARVEAEKEEDRYVKALERARAELRESEGKLHEKMAEQVAKLEKELSEAIDRKAKAIARAQLTKSGHVYVLSNIGSFGERVFKIGMTRRLEPLERVYELGDASVPFDFDVHAMIYSENAPELEKLLHREFDAMRVNKVNGRKEFFRIDLGEIRKAVAKHHGVVTFVLEPEAEDYRKTLAMDEPDHEHTVRSAPAG
jgi:hypothetical protein